MAGIFGGNPFATVVGQRIEQATEATLASENWALNMEICDMINEMEDGPKDAIKAIRKRLQQNAGKNYAVVMYTLTVMETCVKNCGRKFHLLATNKEFVQELVKLIGPKNDPPTAVQEKVLSLIQSWADAFKGNPDMSGVVQVYQDLKLKGVEFPMTDLDAMAPIHTPQRSVPESELQARNQMPVHQISPVPCHQSPPPLQPSHPLPAAGPVILNAEQLKKLHRELEIVQGNMRVFGEMLTELTPGQELSSDWELLQDLNKTCKAMQNRMVELIDKVGNEEVTIELLRLNDELNNLFLRYSRFEKNRGQVLQTQPPPSQPETRLTEESPLIDLEGDNQTASDIHLKLAGMAIGSGNVSSTLSQMNTVSAQQGKATEDEFDMFAQSRTATYEKSKQNGSSYQDNTNIEQTATNLGVLTQKRSPEQEEYFDEKLQNEQDFDEMEAWLKGQVPPGANNGQHRPESLSSSEFDRFLAERAAAADGSSGGDATARSGNPRQVDKDETEKTLFAL